MGDEGLIRLRDEITTKFDKGVMFARENLDGFASIEFLKHGVSGLNCLSYVLDVFDEVDRSVAYKLLKISKESSEPSEGVIVWYYYRGKPEHFALYEQDGIVTSRWAEGPVFRHSALHIPNYFGEPKFYTKPVSREVVLRIVK